MDSTGLSSTPRIPRAWYGASITDFLTAEPEAVIGWLTTNSDFAVLPSQRDAWLQEVFILRQSLEGLEGGLFLEFSIPRMGRRIDAVVILGAAVLALEFKVGEQAFDVAAIEQVWDYALDLKNFHAASHSLPIVPILIATEADAGPPAALRADSDGVYRPVVIGRAHLRSAIDLAIRSIHGSAIQPEEWARAQYRPTPTIIEAARALYAHHSVEAIARFDAGPPPEHVVIFDEAQRAWDKPHTSSFMLRRKKRPGFNQSEPEFLISYMDRHPDWAVIRMPPRNSRSRGWNWIGPVSPGMPTCASPGEVGPTMISAANVGATSPMPRTDTTSATRIAFSSPGRGKAWSSSSRPAIGAIPLDHPSITIPRSDI